MEEAPDSTRWEALEAAVVLDESFAVGSDIPDVIPLLPLKQTVLLPGEVLPLHLVEPAHRDMIRDAVEGSKVLGIVEAMTPPGGLPSPRSGIRRVGCVSRIAHHQRLPDGRYLVWVCGAVRFRILEELQAAVSYRVVRIRVERPRHPTVQESATAVVYHRQLVSVLARLVEEGQPTERSLAAGLDEADHAQLIAVAALVLELGSGRRQRLLEADSVVDRYHLLFEMLRDTAPEALAEDSEELH